MDFQGAIAYTKSLTLSEGAKIGAALLNGSLPEGHRFKDDEIESMRDRLIELTTRHGEPLTEVKHGKEIVTWEPKGLIQEAEEALDRALNG